MRVSPSPSFFLCVHLFVLVVYELNTRRKKNTTKKGKEERKKEKRGQKAAIAKSSCVCVWPVCCLEKKTVHQMSTTTSTAPPCCAHRPSPNSISDGSDKWGGKRDRRAVRNAPAKHQLRNATSFARERNEEKTETTKKMLPEKDDDGLYTKMDGVGRITQHKRQNATKCNRNHHNHTSHPQANPYQKKLGIINHSAPSLQTTDRS